LFRISFSVAPAASRFSSLAIVNFVFFYIEKKYEIKNYFSPFFPVAAAASRTIFLIF